MNTGSMEKIEISIAEDFSEYPAGRYEADGQFSGESFREKHLVPHLKEGKSVEVNIDGVAGLGSSFLEEAFGGLIRVDGFTQDFLDEHLTITTQQHDEMSDFITLIWQYIRNADG